MIKYLQTFHLSNRNRFCSQISKVTKKFQNVKWLKKCRDAQFDFIYITQLVNGFYRKVQGVHKVSLQFKKLLQSEMMRYRNEGCFILISIS